MRSDQSNLELGKIYESTSFDEKSIVDNKCYHINTKFAVGLSKENQEKQTSYIILVT